ncbi:MAG: BTAD domain-containing putative transcriptional regulator [Pseudomonadota bacterium]
MQFKGTACSLQRGALVTDYDLALKALDAYSEMPENLMSLAGIQSILLEFQGLTTAYEEWRQSVVNSMADAALETLRHHFAQSDRADSQRLKLAKLAMAIDPFAEDALRSVMQIEFKLGNSAAALRSYGEYCAHIEAELDAEPSLATQDLAVAIKLASGAEAGARPQVDPQGIARSHAPHTPLTAPATAPPDPTSIAVLPFENTGPGEIPDFVPLGLLDFITVSLASFQMPSVISSNSTWRYLGQRPSPSLVGRELGVQYVVYGSLTQSSNDRLTLAVQMAETASDRVIWAARHHCSVADILAMRTTIAEKIAQAVVPSLDLAELDRTRSLTDAELEPYHLFVRAKDLIFRMERTQFGRAGELLQQAVAMERGFAPAHALLAEWHAINVWQGWSQSPEAECGRLFDHVQRAIRLRPQDGRSIALLAHARFMFRREHDAAMDLGARAIALNPNDSETLIWSVPALAYSGAPARAVENGEKAIRLSPLDPFAFRNEHFLSVAHYVNGDYDSAVRLGLSAFRKAPNYSSNIRATIASLSAADRLDDAGELVAQHASLHPEFSVRAFIPQHGFRDAADREAYARHLRRAGLPK